MRKHAELIKAHADGATVLARTVDDSSPEWMPICFCENSATLHLMFDRIDQEEYLWQFKLEDLTND